VQENPSPVYSGAGSNSKVEGTNCRRKTPAKRRQKKFDVPLHFSAVPLQVGGHNHKYGGHG